MKEIRYDLGGTLAVREVRAEDPDELFALVQANQAHLAPWMPWAGAPTVSETRSWVAGALAQRARDDGFGAVLVEGEAIIGSMGFHRIDWPNRATSLGYWLSADREGAGIMTAAVRTLIRHAFDVWDLHRVEIDAAPDNVRSRAIPERLGFTQEGVRRDAERFGDTYRDLVVYGLLASDPLL
jgi:ribosomal-protein-serine acetyltransferase